MKIKLIYFFLRVLNKFYIILAKLLKKVSMLTYNIKTYLSNSHFGGNNNV